MGAMGGPNPYVASPRLYFAPKRGVPSGEYTRERLVRLATNSKEPGCWVKEYTYRGAP